MSCHGKALKTIYRESAKTEDYSHLALSDLQKKVLFDGLSNEDARYLFMDVLVSAAMMKANFNQAEAARILRIGRTSLVELRKALTKRFGKKFERGDMMEKKCLKCKLYQQMLADKCDGREGKTPTQCAKNS